MKLTVRRLRQLIREADEQPEDADLVISPHSRQNVTSCAKSHVMMWVKSKSYAPVSPEIKSVKARYIGHSYSYESSNSPTTDVNVFIETNAMVNVIAHIRYELDSKNVMHTYVSAFEAHRMEDWNKTKHSRQRAFTDELARGIDAFLAELQDAAQPQPSEPYVGMWWVCGEGELIRPLVMGENPLERPKPDWEAVDANEYLNTTSLREVGAYDGTASGWGGSWSSPRGSHTTGFGGDAGGNITDTGTVRPQAHSNTLHDEETENDPQHKKMAACCLIIAEDGKILAVSRKDDPTAFGLPGGKIDAGELPETAARRELEEETGLKAKSLNLVFVHGDDNGYETWTYACVPEGQIDTDETGVIRWVTPQKLIDGPFGDYMRRLFQHTGAIH